jgi:hypothetical protein
VQDSNGEENLAITEAPLGFYILGNLMIPQNLLRDCQSTKNCCYTCLILFPDDDDDDVAPAFML